MKPLSNNIRYFILVIILGITAAMLLWPNFHPEQKILRHYYWQADVLIHSGYFFLLTMVILSLKLPVKPIVLFLCLGLFSVAMELLQHFSYKRGVSLMDGVDNLLGIALALVAYAAITKKWQRKNAGM